MDEQGGSFVDGMFGGPGGWLDQTTATPAPYGAAKIKVNHDNVLAAAKIIQTQVDALFDVLRLRGEELPVVPAGNDRVSIEVANAWNDRLIGADDSYASRVALYVESLQKLVTQLRDSAKQYGFSEEDIATSFGSLREV